MRPAAESLCKGKAPGSRAGAGADEAHAPCQSLCLNSAAPAREGGRKEGQVLQNTFLGVLNWCSGFGVSGLCSVFSCLQSFPFPGSSVPLWEQQAPSLGRGDLLSSLFW